ncbi:GNAT family N-acetyltransferase [Streptosporangium amethystogenes]|uniref:GNAT family N-acetyltransferase n=1 Tax=Streptosporangium amethystogenes TaxID=2002 RepID=UPI00379749C3
MPPDAAGHPSTPLIRGRVSVRPWTRHDADFLSMVSSLETDLWAPVPLGLSAAQWLSELEATADRGDLGFIIEVQGAEVGGNADVAGRGTRPAPAGLLTLGAFDPHHRVAEITGYWVSPGLRGQGVAATAIDLVTGWAVASLGYARIQIFTRPDNVGSRRAALRAGFAEEGVLRSFVEVAGERSDAVVLSRVHPVSPVPTERNAPSALDAADQAPAHLR